MIVEDVDARVVDNLRWVTEGGIEFHLDDLSPTAHKTVRFVEYIRYGLAAIVNYAAC